VDGLGGAGLCRQGRQGKSLCGPQRLQDGVDPLPRPLQQAAAARAGAPMRGRPLAVGGSPELLPGARRVQEPSQLLVLGEPSASGLAQGGVARGGTAAMGRVPIEQAVQTLDEGRGQADTDDTRIFRGWVRHGFPCADTKHSTM
jgi:hypothetical protein